MNALNSQPWLKKLASFVGVVGAISLIGFPSVAQLSPGFIIFQPSAYGKRYESGDRDPIPATLDKRTEFQTFVNVLKQAGLTDMLKQEGPLTILAPTNEAFDALPADLKQQLLRPENKAQLVKILQYHMVVGLVPKETIENGGGQVTTIEGSKVKISINRDTGEVRLNEAKANAPSIASTNGVIVRVDKILLPPEIAAQLTLGVRPNISSEPAITTALPPASGRRGFFCDTSTVETKLQKANGQQQVWIRWRSRDFEEAGYAPLKRCQEVSSRLETYRTNNQLNFITLGKMNGQNVICTATQPGICTNLIYTLRPDEKDPIGALQAFLAWRTQSASAMTRLESGDRSVPLIDVRQMIAEDGNSTPVTAPNNVPQKRQQPGNSNLPEL